MLLATTTRLSVLEKCKATLFFLIILCILAGCNLGEFGIIDAAGDSPINLKAGLLFLELGVSETISPAYSH